MKTYRFLLVVLLGLLFFCDFQTSSAQEEKTLTQIVRGTVVSSSTKQPLKGIRVGIVDTKNGAISTSNGDFRIKNVPTGRYVLMASGVGFEPYSSQIVVTSGKELVVSIELLEKIVKIEEVVVDDARSQFKAINEAAIVSSNVFTVDDAYRFAGSRGDPARMAQNFAGVLGASDQRNDIIIRGGSPTELLWRLDGLDIPNPNHFATQGATGGPISAININLLANSDFLTGSFPSEYGDRLSGVFDLRTRKGNEEKFEYIGQFGFNGLELGVEGPLKAVNGSFMANYRYSYLGLLKAMGINFGWAGVPEFQDFSAKVDLAPSKDDKISITTLYGTSNINIDQTTVDTVFTGDQNIINGTDIFVTAVNWQRLLTERSYAILTVGTVYNKYFVQVDSITATSKENVTSIDPWLKNNSTEGYHTAKLRYVWAPDASNVFSAGIEGRYRYFDIAIERFTYPFFYIGTQPISKIGNEGTAFQSLNYVNWNWRITDNLRINTGIHTQYLDISKKWSVEPRFSLNWSPFEGQNFSFGTGIYRQSQSLQMYFATQNNAQLDFTQAIHYVTGYSVQLASDMLVKVEGYYKDYSNAPVMRDKINGVSFLNAGAQFGSIAIEDTYVNGGKGRTYGAELTYQKNFSDGYYITATGSLVRQEFTGSDGVWRWGAFDNQFIGNLLAGYEWKIDETFSIEFSGKFTVAGGAPYTPVDLEQSRAFNATRLNNNLVNTERNPNFSRLDGRIDFRQNFNGWSLISFVSVENMLNTQNVSFRLYSPRNDNISTAYQLGVFPIGGVRVEF